MKIQSIKPQLTALRDFWNEDARSLRIPTIQRQFVWDAEDVRDLIDSIVNGYPIGAIIVWEPTTAFPSAPLVGEDAKDSRRYVLDGQQRLTALSLLMNGGWQIKRGEKVIRTSAISYVPDTGKFYLSEKKGIDVSLIVKAALADPDALTKLQKSYAPLFKRAIDEVGSKIAGYQLPMYVLRTDSANDEAAYERIAEIFTRVNSAGVKIGNLEMFLSFFAAAFPRQEKDRIISFHERWSESFELDLEPLVRFVFSRMEMTQSQVTKLSSFRRAIQKLREQYKAKPKDIAKILDRVETSVQAVLGFLDAELGIRTSHFLPSQNALLPLFDYAFSIEAKSDADFDKKNRKRMAYWLLVGSYNGIYSSSPNGKIDEDLDIVRAAKGKFPTDALLKALNQRPPHANGIDRSSLVNERYNVLRGRAGREYLMLLDVLLHKKNASDWAGHRVVSEDAAVHHIFPREFLKEQGETRDEYINCLGNLTLIDPGINSEIGDTPPADYLQNYRKSGVLAQHFIPAEPKLWNFENYDKFLDTRLKMMWTATRELMEELE